MLDPGGVAAPNFIVVKRKFLQLFLANPSDPADEPLRESETFPGVNDGDEDVVVLCDDLEKAMSKLPGHEAARANLFKQMMEGTHGFKLLAEAALDTDGFYVAHHVESRLQKNAVDEEERYLRAAYHQRSSDWDQHFGDQFLYGTPDDHSMAAGRAFLIDQSWDYHQKEKAALVIQQAWRSFKERTAPEGGRRENGTLSETQQEWLRRQKERQLGAKGLRDAEWNPYVQGTMDRKYERSIHAVDAAVGLMPPPALKQSNRPKWSTLGPDGREISSGTGLRGLQFVDGTPVKNKSESGEGDGGEEQGSGTKVRRARTVRWAAAEELSWIQSGDNGRGRDYTAFANLHERVRQMSGPMYQAFAIPESLLNPEAVSAALASAHDGYLAWSRQSSNNANGGSSGAYYSSDHGGASPDRERAVSPYSLSELGKGGIVNFPSNGSHRSSRFGGVGGTSLQRRAGGSGSGAVGAGAMPTACPICAAAATQYQQKEAAVAAAQLRLALARTRSGGEQHPPGRTSDAGEGGGGGAAAHGGSAASQPAAALPSESAFALHVAGQQQARSRRTSQNFLLPGALSIPEGTEDDEPARRARGAGNSDVADTPHGHGGLVGVAGHDGRRAQRVSNLQKPLPEALAQGEPGAGLMSLGLPSPFVSFRSAAALTDDEDPEHPRQHQHPIHQQHQQQHQRPSPLGAACDNPWCLCELHAQQQAALMFKGYSEEEIWSCLTINGGRGKVGAEAAGVARRRPRQSGGGESGHGGGSSVGGGATEGEEEEGNSRGPSDNGVNPLGLHIRGMGQWLSAEEKMHAAGLAQLGPPEHSHSSLYSAASGGLTGRLGPLGLNLPVASDSAAKQPFPLRRGSEPAGIRQWAPNPMSDELRAMPVPEDGQIDSPTGTHAHSSSGAGDGTESDRARATLVLPFLKGSSNSLSLALVSSPAPSLGGSSAGSQQGGKPIKLGVGMGTGMGMGSGAAVKSCGALPALGGQRSSPVPAPQLSGNMSKLSKGLLRTLQRSSSSGAGHETANAAAGAVAAAMAGKAGGGGVGSPQLGMLQSPQSSRMRRHPRGSHSGQVNEVFVSSPTGAGPLPALGSSPWGGIVNGGGAALRASVGGSSDFTLPSANSRRTSVAGSLASQISSDSLPTPGAAAAAAAAERRSGRYSQTGAQSMAGAGAGGGSLLVGAIIGAVMEDASEQ